MYLIHFHSKNIKMCFPKSWVFSFKPTTSIHLPSQCGEINCVDISKDFTTACQWIFFLKVINNYNIYRLKKRFFHKNFKIFFKNKN